MVPFDLIVPPRLRPGRDRSGEKRIHRCGNDPEIIEAAKLAARRRKAG
jgi:hypothetical protein